MKKTYRASLLLAAFSTMANFACGGISLAWEYTFDGASVGNPLHTYSINGVKTSPSGAVAIYISNDVPDDPEERRVVLLNKDGTQKWVSANLMTEPPPNWEVIKFLHVSENSIIFAYGDEETPITVCMYNSKATPVFTSTTLESEVVDTRDNLTEYPRFSLINTPTSFFSLKKGSTYPDGYSSLKKYSLDVVSTQVVVAQTASGVSGSNLVLKWSSGVNTQYQVQESDDLSTWSDIGSPITGTGSMMSWSAPITTATKFYRITQQP
jgi:hypothetical protein